MMADSFAATKRSPTRARTKSQGERRELSVLSCVSPGLTVHRVRKHAPRRARSRARSTTRTAASLACSHSDLPRIDVAGVAGVGVLAVARRVLCARERPAHQA